MADALMSGFAMFSLKCPSLLDYDKPRADANLKTIYGIQCPPCDSYMREVLDPLAPESLRPSFKAAFRQLQRGKALEEMVFFTGCYLVALDGTGYFSSKKDAWSVVPRKAPPRRLHNLFASDVGCRAHASRSA